MRKDSDETYVLDLCDELLGCQSQRQATFDFLRGDPGRLGMRRCLPVDAFYVNHALVIEYRERQRSEAIRHFDKPDRITVSGVHRGEQRRLYDNRRRELLPANGLLLVEIDWTCLASTKAGRLRRDRNHDKSALRAALELAGVEFVAENGGGAGVRLRK